MRALSFQARVLRGIDRVDLATRILGVDSRLPLVIGPTGFAGLFWPGADVILAKAAAAAGIPFVLSTAATASIERVASHGPAGAQRWFQLYLLNDRSASADMVNWAAAAAMAPWC